MKENQSMKDEIKKLKSDNDKINEEKLINLETKLNNLGNNTDVSNKIAGNDVNRELLSELNKKITELIKSIKTSQVKVDIKELEKLLDKAFDKHCKIFKKEDNKTKKKVIEDKDAILLLKSKIESLEIENKKLKEQQREECNNTIFPELTMLKCNQYDKTLVTSNNPLEEKEIKIKDLTNKIKTFDESETNEKAPKRGKAIKTNVKKNSKVPKKNNTNKETKKKTLKNTKTENEAKSGISVTNILKNENKSYFKDLSFFTSTEYDK
ncbi:hypothetical protein HERIO_2062 [Hepatospora eriocheir]|uniref:Uncharacterized protein n=1 Tax=Hepatospora eriocheir TaxID=1081669 RepID=A0A1X0Q852_9MICR|nr:hypothetical protein HERIO_2062 [Hepatospora eriocheir]